ncbi:MAG: hypothetical protein RL885_33000 [Planctomycetota bacterium]
MTEANVGCIGELASLPMLSVERILHDLVGAPDVAADVHIGRFDARE